MKIGLKITMLMVIMSIFSIGVLGVVLIHRAQSTASYLAQNLGLVRAQQIGEEFTTFFDDHWSIVSVMASMLGQFESIQEDSRRAFLDEAVMSVLDAGQFITNVWSIWDPNVLEGDDAAWIGAPGTDERGRFVPGYTRTKAGHIVAHPMRDFGNEEFYLTPRRLGKQVMTNPYKAVLAGETRSVASISAPIRNSHNAIVGVAGLDMNIEYLDVLGQDFKRIFPGTLTAAFSNDGTVVSHFDKARIGRNMMETEGDLLRDQLQPFANAVRLGSDYRVDLMVGNEMFMFFAIPIRIGDSADKWSFAIALSERQVNANTYGMIKFAIVMCLALLALVGLVAMLVSRSVAKPIVGMAQILNDIANGDGDLTVRLPEGVGDQEISEASKYFNMTIRKIRDTIVAIKGQAESLSDIGNDLASNMTETAAAMNEITATIQSIKSRAINQSASVTETNATMEQVTHNIDKLSGHVDEQADAISQASSSIEQMIANIQSVTATLARNNASVLELRESSETGKSSLQEVASDVLEIERESEGLFEINSVMENIASQTNLLSMNAAIEAAHAGEAGKGFAVVADEIRKLAESSGEQSQTIKSVLSKIKVSIEKITRSTDNVLKKFEAIDTGVRTVAEQEAVIHNAMEEQSQGSRQILQASGQVSQITLNVKGGSIEMREGSKEVIQESKNLERATQEITQGMNEMALSADQVNNAVHNVNDLSNKNREGISVLVRAISQFKV